MIRHAIRLAATCSIVALSQAPVAAFADEAATNAAAADSGESARIIVTATKRETDLQKTPIAIAVIGSWNAPIPPAAQVVSGGRASTRCASERAVAGAVLTEPRITFA